MNDVDPVEVSSGQIESTAIHHDVTARVVKGAMALGVRQVVVHSANVLGNILLARLLSPRDYGVFAIVNFFILFLGAFGGTGLAANLIREHPQPGPEVSRAVYSFQQISVLAIALLLWLGAPALSSAYHLGHQEIWVFRFTALSLLATVYMVPPQIAMERSLEFRKLALVETVQSFSFNIVAVLMAWRGFGAISFGVALLVRSVGGSILANLLEPVPYGWSFRWDLARPHLKFGLFFQGATIISLVKDSITPVLIGLLVGSDGVGYLSWAAMTATYPVFALAVLQRLYLPAFARFQHDLPRFGRFLEQIIWATNAIAAPFSVMLLVLIHPIVSIVFGSKWEPAIPLFYLLWTSSLFFATVTPVQNVFSALGKAHLSTLTALMWMLLTWSLGWPLALRMGTRGIALATAIVQLSNLALFRVAQTYVPFRILRTVYIPWLVAIGMGLLLLATIHIHLPTSLLALIAFALGSTVLYAGTLLVVDRGRINRLRQLLLTRSRA